MRRSFKRVKGTVLLGEDPFSIARAGLIIRECGLVAFPTETVYGLGAAATDHNAVKKIFRAKGRPADNPLIVHVASLDQLESVSAGLPPVALLLAEQFWPGPLSLVVPRSETIPSIVSAGLPTVAVRMPDHRVALDFIVSAGVPIAAPSANLSGKPSPTSYRHVLEDLAGRIEAVIKSDPCLIGLESTVLDLTGERPQILRPGGLSREKLERALGCSIIFPAGHEDLEPPRSPGMKYRHYSPRAPLLLISGPATRRGQVIQDIAKYYSSMGYSVGLLNEIIGSSGIFEGGEEQMAAGLYDALRHFDQVRVDFILAEEVDPSGIGFAIMNRLLKAAARVLKV